MNEQIDDSDFREDWSENSRMSFDTVVSLQF